MDGLVSTPGSSYSSATSASLALSSPTSEHVLSTISISLSYKLRANSKSFSVAHLNVRSLISHFSDLADLLLVCCYKFDLMALTETWLRAEHDSGSLALTTVLGSFLVEGELLCMSNPIYIVQTSLTLLPIIILMIAFWM